MTVVLLTRGKKFRTAFSELGGLRALVKIPTIASTASAPPAIEKAITDSLELQNPVTITNLILSWENLEGGGGGWRV